MDVVAQILDRTLSTAENDGLGVVWRKAARLGVHPDEAEGLPHHVDQLVDVPPFF